MRLAAPLLPDPTAPLARANPVAKLGAASLLLVALFASLDWVTPTVVLVGLVAAVSVSGLRARDLYPADPVRFRSKLSFTDDAGHRMGEAVVVRAAEAREARLALDRARPGWHLVWVLNGERRPAVRLPEGAVTETLRFGTRADAPTWVRAEIWDLGHEPDGTALETPAADPLRGRCLALTNPIWYVPRR